jgi:hypothetical protein
MERGKSAYNLGDDIFDVGAVEEVGQDIVVHHLDVCKLMVRMGCVERIGDLKFWRRRKLK